ncbi:hypothetical protein [Aestuariivirga sp.]|uniref:hypothetical protein n=1 Tax=Aestuariivirga sp. TaxID=2650926 RepID=UPI0037832172
MFDPELPRITMIFCYDDTNWEPAHLAAVKCSNIMAYICSSHKLLPQLKEAAAGKHSTFAIAQHQCA